jgi:hypothetical protein
MPGDRTGSISVADVVASIVLTVFADVAPADSSSGVHQLEDLVDRTHHGEPATPASLPQ